MFSAVSAKLMGVLKAFSIALKAEAVGASLLSALEDELFRRCKLKIFHFHEKNLLQANLLPSPILLNSLSCVLLLLNVIISS
jgi:hypothetical protein